MCIWASDVVLCFGKILCQVQKMFYCVCKRTVKFMFRITATSEKFILIKVGIQREKS